MHIVIEYCSNIPFHPMPQFISKPQPLKKFSRSATKGDEDWFATDSKLGIDFAICKANSTKSCDKNQVYGLIVITQNGSMKYEMPDKLALKKLFEIRKNDLRTLRGFFQESTKFPSTPLQPFTILGCS